MEHIRVAKVEEVTILHRGQPTVGTIHLTPHHLIFRANSDEESNTRPTEIWITYPIIANVYRNPPSAGSQAHIRLRNRDFMFLMLQFRTDRECREVFESIKSLSVVKSVEKLYAFFYTPGSPERRHNGWAAYDPRKEYERMGVGTDKCKGWRISRINKDYTFSPTYPQLLVVPATISDTTLSHAKNYRSRARIPVLTYLHPLNNCSITRCAQPLTGVRGNRSIQDEKLVAAIFASSQPQNASQTPAYLTTSTPSPNGSSTNLSSSSSVDNGVDSITSEPVVAEGRVYGAQQHNLIVDARPTVNAYAMQAVGMGSENMDNYRHCSSPPCSKTYLGIDNIHVMRDSLAKVVDAIKDFDISPLSPSKELLVRSGWLKHIGLMLDGTSIIVRQIAVEHSHVLIHCSDGWDRTSQLSSLAQICLDPYFRTIDGFIALVEKDWVSFGHRFRDRCGFLGCDKWFVETNRNAPPTAEEGALADEDPLQRTTSIGSFTPTGGFGEALEKGFGQAKNFFNTVNRSSSATDNDSDPDSSNIDRKTKLANLASTPVHVTKPKEVSPMFQQFLDATYQLLYQNPTRFEYNERFLRRLLYHLYSCQYGTFLFNNDKERADTRVKERTRSVWDYFLARRNQFANPLYDPGADGVERERDVGGGRVLFPRSGGAVRWWEEVWGRDSGEMNGCENALNIGAMGMEERSRTPISPGEAGTGAAAGTAGSAGSIGGAADSGVATSSGLAVGSGAGVTGVAGRLGGVVEGVKRLSISPARSDSTSERRRTPVEVEMM
ncbi:protein phosphatase [Morchella snyderi]|nr:protein phosphatase [Morchella snyderi]